MQIQELGSLVITNNTKLKMTPPPSHHLEKLWLPFVISFTHGFSFLFLKIIPSNIAET
jgi:hypothetical protein